MPEVWSFCPGRIKVLSVMRGKDDSSWRSLLSELRKAASGRCKVLFRVRYSGPVGKKSRMRKIIGDYAVTARLGGGRYGVCFLGKTSDGQKVVLKRFRRRMWLRNRANNHFEAVILSGLSHSAVPEMLGVVNCSHGYYFVLEYMEGISLKKRLFTEKKVFAGEEILRIGTQLFDILAYLHSCGVVHGDISLSNIVDDGKKVSLIDFGLARYVREGQKEGGFSLDYARTADVLIHLLYSSYSGGGDRPWHEELPLSREQKHFLKRLFGIAEEFGNTAEAGRELPWHPHP